MEQSPFTIFEQWYAEAQKHEIEFPDAMTLATVNSDGHPSVRVVLMKDFSPSGFVFYTNLTSQKAQELLENPHVCLNFHWKSMKKQIRIVGITHPVADEVADQYFASRPRASQLGAWASKQSQEMPDRFSLEKRLVEYTAKFGLGSVPRPPFWSGFCVEPSKIEFWHEKPYRLHERIVYIRNQQSPQEWTSHRLFP